MATLLESYNKIKDAFVCNPAEAMPDPNSILKQQELLYRIGVLEICQMFAKTTPLTAEPKALYWHYQMVDAHFQNLTIERQFSASKDDKVEKQRNTAHGNLLKVIKDYRARFSSFTPGDDPECYRKTITAVISAVLPAWMQYRETFIEIPMEGA